MTLVYIYVALAAYNTGHLTLPMHSIENLVDDVANVAVIDGKGRMRCGGAAKMKNPNATTALTVGGGGRPWLRGLDWSGIWNEGTDAVMDVPIGGVCEVLYGGGEEGDDDDDDDDDGQVDGHASGNGHHPPYRRAGSPFMRQRYTYGQA